MKLEEDIVGQKVWVEYYDQNFEFERCFPAQKCDIVRQMSSTSGSNDWFLLKLEQPFVYLGREHTQMVVRSRWQDRSIGVAEHTSIFILLLRDDSSLHEPIDVKDFDHVAWGMLYAIDGAN